MPTEPWNLDHLCDVFGHDEVERELVSQASNSINPGEMPVARAQAISELFLAKSIQRAVEKMTNSNEKLFDSNEKYSDRMVRLTRALVFVVLVQAVVAVVQTIPFIVQAVPLIRAWL